MLLIIGFDVNSLAGVVNGVLPVFPGEGDGGREAVLREHPCGIEIVFSVLGIIPAAHQAVMLAGMLHHGGDALFVETVLGGDIRHHKPLVGLPHSVEVEGESVRIHLAHRPNGVV